VGRRNLDVCDGGGAGADRKHEDIGGNIVVRRTSRLFRRERRADRAALSDAGAQAAVSGAACDRQAPGSLPVLAIASIVVLLVHFEWPIYAAGAIALAASALALVARQLTRRQRH